jgi:hypothetical protein
LKILKKRKLVVHFFDPGENNLVAAKKGLSRALVRQKETTRRIRTFPCAGPPRGRRKPEYAKRKGSTLLLFVLFQGIVAQIDGSAGPPNGLRETDQAGRRIPIGFPKNSNLCESRTGTAPAFGYAWRKT